METTTGLGFRVQGLGFGVWGLGFRGGRTIGITMAGFQPNLPRTTTSAWENHA